MVGHQITIKWLSHGQFTSIESLIMLTPPPPEKKKKKNRLRLLLGVVSLPPTFPCLDVIYIHDTLTRYTCRLWAQPVLIPSVSLTGMETAINQ